MESVPIRFGDCRLDVDARRLFRGSQEVELPPKAFELLKALIDARPRALSKAQLLDQVWPGVFVSDGSLAKAVNKVRAAVGDTAHDAGIVRTVHRYGYAFVADVADEAPPHTPLETERRSDCWLLWGRREFPLPDGEHIVGRDPDAGVSLESSKISRRHARLRVTGTRVTIEDLGSKNGTFVGGRRIAGQVTLEPGDTIRVGSFALVFRVASPRWSTETESSSRDTDT